MLSPHSALKQNQIQEFQQKTSLVVVDGFHGQVVSTNQTSFLTSYMGSLLECTFPILKHFVYLKTKMKNLNTKKFKS